MYHFNTVELDKQKWWISSASTQKDIQYYHQHYVQHKQSLNRTVNYMYLASNLLKNRSVFFSTDIMSKYSSLLRFSGIRQNEVQPSPEVHMCYVEEEILPLMPIQPKIERIMELRSRINRVSWVAYDPDREQIWKELTNF